MKVFFGTDHAGFEMKEVLKEFVGGLGYDVEDKGAFEYNKDDDYPDFVVPVAKEVLTNPSCRGIILGGTGQGEAVVANRFPKARSVVYYGGNTDIIKLSREHNNSNILSLGARFLGHDEAKDAVELWLKTPFNEDERHIRRIQKIETITLKHCPDFYKRI